MEAVKSQKMCSLNSFNYVLKKIATRKNAYSDVACQEAF